MISWAGLHLLFLTICSVQQIQHAHGGCRKCSKSGGPGTESMIMTEFINWKHYTLGSVVSNINGSLYTHVSFNFVNPSNGGCTIADGWGDILLSFPSSSLGSDTGDPYKGHLNQLRKLKVAYPHLKTIMNIGGWDFSYNLSAIAADPTSRTNLAISCVDFMQYYGFDGINIQWDYPNGGGKSGNAKSRSDPNNFNELLSAFRATLPSDSSLSASVFFSPYNMNTRYNLSGMAPYVDWINIRDHSFWGGWNSVIGHSANINPPDPQSPHQRSVTADLSAVSALGVPPCKILLSVPSSGYGWILPSNPISLAFPSLYALGTAELSMTGSDLGLYTYAEIQRTMDAQQGWTSLWDNKAKASMVYLPSSRKIITIDSVSVAISKAQYIASKGYGGINVADFHGDELCNQLSTAISVTLQSAMPCSQTTTTKQSTSQIMFMDPPTALSALNVSTPSPTPSSFPDVDRIGVQFQALTVLIFLDIDATRYSSMLMRFEISKFIQNFNTSLRIDANRIVNAKLTTHGSFSADLTFTILPRTRTDQLESAEIVSNFDAKMQDTFSDLRQGSLLRYAPSPPIVIAVTTVLLRRCPSNVFLHPNIPCPDQLAESESTSSDNVHVVAFFGVGIALFILMIIVYVNLLRDRNAKRRPQAVRTKPIPPPVYPLQTPTPFALPRLAPPGQLAFHDSILFPLEGASSSMESFTGLGTMPQL